MLQEFELELHAMVEAEGSGLGVEKRGAANMGGDALIGGANIILINHDGVRREKKAWLAGRQSVLPILKPRRFQDVQDVEMAPRCDTLEHRAEK